MGLKVTKKRQTTFPKNQQHLDPQNVTIWRFRHDLVTLPTSLRQIEILVVLTFGEKSLFFVSAYVAYVIVDSRTPDPHFYLASVLKRLNIWN